MNRLIYFTSERNIACSGNLQNNNSSVLNYMISSFNRTETKINYYDKDWFTIRVQ